jgi:hypothetical protein
LKNAMQHLVDTLSIDTVCELMPLFALVILWYLLFIYP